MIKENNTNIAEIVGGGVQIMYFRKEDAIA